MSSRRAIFLDRDGVLNASILDSGGRPLPPRAAGELAILPGVVEACAQLRAAGFLLIGCTNQPDIARGTTPRSFVDWVNAEVASAVGLHEMRVCPHDDADGCHCRKPMPGMLTDAAAAHDIDLAASWMVGDRFRDIEAGQAAGCRTLFIDYGYSERPPVAPPDAVASSLADGLAFIIPHSRITPMSITAQTLRVKIYADGADKAGMLAIGANPLIQGFTTNPTLMRKAGISDYAAFAKDILSEIRDRPISFEVFSDEFDEMEAQCAKIASWGENVYVKVPITNTRGESIIPLLRRLAPSGVKFNVTALFTEKQVQETSDALADAAPCNISVFAGRVADAGVDPLPLMRRAVEIMKSRPQQELIWASPREIYNVVQAHDIGCHIITMTNDILAKLPGLGKDLEQFSLETVKMFRTDAVAAGFTL